LDVNLPVNRKEKMQKKLQRTVGAEAMILGVCGGLAKYLDIDPTILRIVAALLVIFSVGGIILAYFIMALIMPKEVF
jgi:phage shock protein C